MHTWPIAKSFQAWALSILVVCGVLPLFGCADAGVTVTLTEWPAGASEVRILPSLDGTPGSEIVLTRDQSVFVVRVPQGQGGVLAVSGLAYDGVGCKVASGSLEQALPRGLRPYADAKLTLSALSPATCALTLSVQGSGSAKAQWTASGGVPQQLDCVEGTPCKVDLPLNSSAPLSVSISARETSRREYPSIAGGCLGLHDCQLRMDRAQTVSVRMVARQCLAGGFCVYSPLPYAAAWYGIWGSGPSDIWAVGIFATGSAAIAHFDGQSWKADPATGKIPGLLAVWGSSPTDVWAVGYNGTVQRYNGTGWSTVSSTTTNTLHAVWGTSAEDVWIAGDNGTIRRWNGTNFGVPASSGPTITGNFWGIWGSARNDVWVVGDGGWAWHYTGVSGAKVDVPPTTLPLLSVWGTGPSDVWATAGSAGTGLIIRWDGSAWKQVQVLSGVEPMYNSVWGIPAGPMWLVGMGGSVVQGKDGLWSPLVSPTSEQLRAGWASSATDFWIVGDNGTILHSDGRTLQSYGEGHNGVWTAQWGSAPDDIWLVGRAGKIAHWDGIKYTLHTEVGPVVDLTSIAGVAKDDVYVFGTRAQISHFDGRAWAGQVAPSSVTNLHAGWASGPADVWAGGSRVDSTGILIRKTTGGWAEIPTSSPLRDSTIGAMHGTSPSDLWICSRVGVCTSWNGSMLGSNTAISLTPGTQTINGLWTASTGEAWVSAGIGGVFMRTQRGGSFTLSAPSSVALYSAVYGTSKSDVWVGDMSGFASHWDGSTWSRTSLAPSGNVTALFQSGPSDLWLSLTNPNTQGSTVLRYVP